MRRKVTLGVLVAGMMLAPRIAEACAGCSNPNLPGARSTNVGLTPGQLSVALNLTATTMRVVHPEACPEIGPICAKRAEPAQQHDQRFYVAELRPVLTLGLTDAFAVEVQAPVRMLRTTITFRRPDGAAFTPDYENIHHRDETIVGLGDPWLLGRSTGRLGPLTVTARGGLGLPVGSTEPNPFAVGRAGLSHQHVQLGTGTFFPVFALDVGTTLGRARLGGYGQALVFPYANGHGYQAGNRYSGGVSADYEVLADLRVGFGGDVVNEQPERWERRVEQDGNVGRTDVLAGGAVTYLAGRVALSISVRAPVWQHFIEGHTHGGDPGQLTYPAIVSLGVQTTFGGLVHRPDRS